jgi:hypothetical protein
MDEMIEKLAKCDLWLSVEGKLYKLTQVFEGPELDAILKRL